MKNLSRGVSYGISGSILWVLCTAVFLVTLSVPALAQFEDEEALILSVEGCYQVQTQEEERQLNRSEGSALSPRGRIKDVETEWISVKELAPSRYAWFHLILDGRRPIFTHADEWIWQPRLITSLTQEATWKTQTLPTEVTQGKWSHTERTPYGTVAESCLGKINLGTRKFFSCSPDQLDSDQALDPILIGFNPKSKTWTKIHRHSNGVTNFVTYKKVDESLCTIKQDVEGDDVETSSSDIWFEREHQIEALYDVWNQIFSTPGTRTQLRSPFSNFALQVNQILENSRKKEETQKNYTAGDLRVELKEFMAEWTKTVRLP